ncbi:MAG: VCBS repeat-containing protein [Polyangiaceae bacterium]|nr:VCBS repeat-containing protein [Polyangiaceae bacterium]
MKKHSATSTFLILTTCSLLAAGCSDGNSNNADSVPDSSSDGGSAARCLASDLWQDHVIGSHEKAMYIDVRDIDGDGDLDVLAASMVHRTEADSTVAWYRNDGNAQAWTQVIIAAKDNDPIKNTTGVVAADINRDGRIDAAVATARPGLAQVYWLEAPEDPTTEQWEKHLVHEDSGEVFYKLYAWDANDDGWLDLVVGGMACAVLLANPGGPGGGSADWEVHHLPDKTGTFIFLADMDDDARLDVVSSNFYANAVSWSSVEDVGGSFSYNMHVVDDSLAGAFDVFPVDITGNGRKDLIITRIMKPGIQWYEAPEARGGAWAKHTLSSTFRGADLYAGDIDLDGDVDFVVSGVAMGNAAAMGANVTWFRRDGGNDAPSWSPQPLRCLDPDAPGDIALDDIDGDGDLDVITTVNHEGAVVWYENQLAIP